MRIGENEVVDSVVLTAFPTVVMKKTRLKRIANKKETLV